ncbi:putative cystathionine gamma-synthase NDAI_0D03260 [Naumovozyma dairenensis CBS 421]|uniref:Cystathionine gamma-synthase n=1 Tax=Naumovozyma dairenensis (strain ATCC 10597 / BCRC 20456 / CBS 421 / NBRC 0211 / NRRL Y-12639) TaxID=1071378 RepID=G0WA29_NAUDC|nr:hypothetical protein NDAI_0D03260 [Naumovozyma dairenensis CBS 421]CCD24640.1 hypothetical protein NDAI_0D03260 [Naumovozyma dairenensis CBS 421]
MINRSTTAPPTSSLTWDDIKDIHPRIKLAKSVKRLCEILSDRYAKENETCICFPSYTVAKRCREYIAVKVTRASTTTTPPKVRILQLATSKPKDSNEMAFKRECKIAVVFTKREFEPLMMEYWRLSGEIISEYLAEYVLHELFMLEKSTRTTIPHSIGEENDNDDEKEFIESRYGRNFNFTFTDRAKSLIKKRITKNVMDSDYDHDHDDENENYHFNDRNNGNNMSTFLDTHINGNNNNSNSQGFDDREDEEEPTPYIHSTIPAEPIDMDETLPLANDERTHTNNTNGTVSRTVSDIDTNHISTSNMRSNSFDTDNGSGGNSIPLNPETDVYLFTSGMAALFTAHRLLLHFDSQRVDRLRYSITDDSTPSPNGTFNNRLIGYGSPYKETVMFGFPSVDTLEVLQKFNHTHFLSDNDEENSAMSKLKEILHSGEQILAVFIEAPSNPLLKMGDLIELKRLSDMYGFFIIVDETIAGFVNIDAIIHADIICSSLTKVFTGDSNVIAGSMVLNPMSKIYDFAKRFLSFPDGFEDCLWCEDILYLEKNSRDFLSKTTRINNTTEYLVNTVLSPYVGKKEANGKLFKKIYYPTTTSKETKMCYDAIKCKTYGGYGGVFSITFHDIEKAKLFFNNLKLSKTISLGSNYTTVCPYTVLKHGDELEKVSEYGLDETLIRVCVGLENKTSLKENFSRAIEKTMNN